MLVVELLASIRGNARTVDRLYGGGLDRLRVQIVGGVGIGARSVVTCGVMYTAIKGTIGLRVRAEEKIIGLDIDERGAVAYSDLLPTAAPQLAGTMTSLPTPQSVQQKKLQPEPSRSTSSVTCWLALAIQLNGTSQGSAHANERAPTTATPTR